MNQIFIKPNKINFDKLSASFSWDDNFISHYFVIAEIFKKYNSRCTFYINIGESNFNDIFLDKYRLLLDNDFELGNHFYRHVYSTSLTECVFRSYLLNSISSWITLLGETPTTFAFPYHDSNDFLLNIVKDNHLETRNTISNTVRISLNTKSSIDTLIEKIKLANSENENIVFSGHSIIAENIFENLYDEDLGYEPIMCTLLDSLIKYIISIDAFQILTVEQAALKEFIIQNDLIDNNCIFFSSNMLTMLKKKGLSFEKIKKII